MPGMGIGMAEKTAAPAFTVKAKVAVNYPGGRSTTDCTTAQGLGDEALHILIQAVGTADAWVLINEKMSGYRADYKGLAEEIL